MTVGWERGDKEPGDRYFDIDGNLVLTVVDRPLYVEPPPVNPDDVITILKRTRDRLATAGWIKGKLGSLYDLDQPTCLTGAMAAASMTVENGGRTHVQVHLEVQKFLKETFGWDDNIPRWNDAQKDVETVLKMLTDLVERLESR